MPSLALAALLVSVLPPPSLATPPQSPVMLPGFPMIAGDNVLLVWSRVPDAVSYRVFLNGKGLGTTGATTHMIPLPDSGEEARFQVSAISEKGEESPPGPAGILRLRKIGSPAGLESAVNPDQPSVSLVWKAVPEAVGYNVYRMEGKGEPVLLRSGTGSQFWDRSVRKGGRYGYAVAAIDRFGREGERSPLVLVGVPEEAQPAEAAQVPPGASSAHGPGMLRRGREIPVGKESEKGRERAVGKAKEGMPSPLLDAAFREVMSIQKIRSAPLGEVSYLGPGIDNVFWVVLPRPREVHAIGPSGEVVATLGPAQLDAAAEGFVPHKLAVGPDGRLVITDARNGMVACFDRKGDLAWRRRVVPPSADAKKIWEGFPASFRNLPPSPSSVLILPAEILVSDQRLQLIYRLGHGGELLGHITHYKKGKDTWRLRRVGELEAIPGKGILLTFPLVRKALLVNEEFLAVSEILGSRKDRKKGFLGLHGAHFVPGEGVLLTDPETGKVQLFDLDTGEHVREVKTPALLYPNMAVWDGKDRLWVYLARESRIAVLGREDSGRMPVGK